MANTININIKNCCCGGVSTADGGVIEVPTEILPDPTGPDGPPIGFSEPSEITGRQCKASIFVYELTIKYLDKLVNTTPGNMIVNSIQANMFGSLTKAVLVVFSALLGGVLSSVVTAGPNIDDVLFFPLGAALAGFTASYVIKAFKTANVTLPLLEDALTKLPDARDMLICKMATAETPTMAYAEMEKVLGDAQYDLSLSQRTAIFGLVPPAIISLLYWGADWWPTFETETLSSITETCCGLLEPGYPLLPGSTTRCNTANYVFDLLLETFQITGEFVNNYVNSWYDLQLDFEAEAYDYIRSNLVLPRKVTQTAYSLPLFQRNLAKYIVSVWLSWNPVATQMDTTFSDMVDHFVTNAEDIICSLYTSLNAAQASTALIDEHQLFLDTTSLESEQKIYLHGAIMGIIHADGQFINLLFTQDSDVLGYTGAFECDGCGWVDPGSDGEWSEGNTYFYPYGICTSSADPGANAENGDGPHDDVPTNGIDTDGFWRCEFSLQRTITADMTLELYTYLTDGSYANWRIYAIIDGVDTLIRSLNTIGFTGWEGGALGAYVGQTLEGIHMNVNDPGPGQDPDFAVDGVRIGGITP